jgi:hypothetical protein
MRDWLFAGSVAAMLFGLGFGIALRPEMAMLDDAVADLTFCEIDRDDAIATAKVAVQTASKKTQERDGAVKHSEEWQGWYEDAHRDRTALTAKLGALQTELAAFRFAYEAKSAELRSARAEQQRAAAAPVPVPKAVPKKLKRKLAKRKAPKRIVYHWHFF